jgi:two-component system response regulator
MSSHKILLVEDNVDDVELTMHAFRSHGQGTDVVVAHDGEEALDYIYAQGSYADRKEGMPALLLLDLKLPGISGLDVLRRVRSVPETRRMPVVILTTSDDEGDIITGYDLGANSYIRKPVEFGSFTRVVEQLGLYWLMINTPAPH